MNLFDPGPSNAASRVSGESDDSACGWCGKAVQVDAVTCPSCQGNISSGRAYVAASNAEATSIQQRPTAPIPSSKPKASAGWYPHPTMAATRRYWDGEAWTENIAPMDSPPPAATRQDPSKILGAVVLAAAVVGVIMASQSASLLTGTGTQWTGTAIALGASVIAGLMRRSIQLWIRILVALAAVFALASVIYLEHQLDHQRQEISNLVH